MSEQVIQMQAVPFEKQWLAQYKQVSGPSKLEIQVKGRPQFYYNEDTGRGSYIVNLKAIRTSDLPKIREIFAGRDSVEAPEMNGLILTHNIFVNDGVEPIVPGPNETVIANFDFVENREGDEILACTSLFVKQASKGKKIDLDALFAEEESLAEEDIDDVTNILDDQE